MELAPDSRLEQNVSSKIDQQTKTESVSFFGLFATADATDCVLMFLGCFGSCVHGAALPVFFILFGRMIDSLGHLSNDPHKLSSRVSEVLSPSSTYVYHYYFILLLYFVKCLIINHETLL